MHYCSCIMVCHIISKPLLQVVVIVQVLLNGPSWAEEVVGNMGNNINISFSFPNTSKAKVESVGLYKDGIKIGECNVNHVQNCSWKKATWIFNMATTEAVFWIQKLTLADKGTYWATLFSNSRTFPIVKSNEVTLTLESDRITTESSSITNNIEAEDNDGTESNTNSTFTILIVIAVLGLPSVAMLLGLLIWFCWTEKRNPERDKQEDFSAKPKESGEASTSMPVYSVEYGVVSFNNKPSGGKGAQHERAGNIMRPSETVEYATITFPPRQRGANGR
ncbi:uncharacterized protein LOC105025357 [Esox lucius]|uniref:uncharacterized protein LOC105025357 n=1 Tax=Esox lucius TaxID=8010 RepID=UPI000578020B|nr:uncharacterized protein LOC105025357 [Esox lucius]